MDPRLEHRAAPDAPALLRPDRPAGLGAIALASLLRSRAAAAAAAGGRRRPGPGIEGFPNFAPRAKRVIYLFQSGAPSQIDLFDPQAAARPTCRATDLPDSIRMGQRLTGMTSRQDRFPVAASRFRVRPARPERRDAVSELLPHTARSPTSSASSSRCTPRRSTTTRPSPSSRPGPSSPGRPSIGAWVSYGLGSENQDLPAFVVMISQGTGNPNDQPLYDRLWGSGFLPTTYQGVKFRSVGDPVLYLSNPPGVSRRGPAADARRPGQARRDQSPRVRRPRDPHADRPVRDGLPDADLGPRADRPLGRARLASSTCTAPTSRTPGTFAANCLLARRLAERGVRFIQLFHRGWDQHTHLPKQIAGQCRDTDQPSAALVTRPQAARAARRHPGRLGRRVRPDRLLPGHADRRRLRPRPPSALLHRSGWPAAASSPASPTARPTTSATTSPATRSTSTTCTPRSCIAWASTTRG